MDFPVQQNPTLITFASQRKSRPISSDVKSRSSSHGLNLTSSPGLFPPLCLNTCCPSPAPAWITSYSPVLLPTTPEFHIKCVASLPSMQTSQRQGLLWFSFFISVLSTDRPCTQQTSNKTMKRAGKRNECTLSPVTHTAQARPGRTLGCFLPLTVSERGMKAGKSVKSAGAL